MAIKDSSGDVPHMMRMIAAVRPIRPDFIFLTGWDAVLVPMLLIGCDGGTNATSGVVPEMTRQALRPDARRPARRGPAAAVPRCSRLFDAALLGRFPRGLPRGGRTPRLPHGRGRQPLSEKHRAELGKLEKTLADLLAEEGLAAMPRAPPSAAGNFDPRQIGRIVAGVLAALKQRGVL